MAAVPPPSLTAVAASRVSQLHIHLGGSSLRSHRRPCLAAAAPAAPAPPAPSPPAFCSATTSAAAAAEQRKLRVGVVGLGGRGTGTLRTMERSERLRAKMEVVALADVDPAALEPHRGGKYTLFNSASDMIRSGLIDTLLIVTPHYYHTSIGIEAFQAGLHVMTEKPISVHKADAEKLIAAYEARPHQSQQFGAMFNNRNNATYNKVRDMVASGELGKISRVNWIITTWFRPQSYYDRGGWRGTWAGEGGGVLTNQCPHNLDLLQWMLGMMPTTVKAICRLGHSHDIEVEDDVTAILEYANGASGVFVTTTGEAPGTNRLEIVGSRGRLVAETTGIPTPEDPSGGRKDTLIFTRNNTETDASLRGEGSVGPPEFVEIPVRAPEIADDTEAILSNFFDAIFDPSVKLISHAPEGIKGVELANAMVYAGLTGETVALPMDGSKFEDLLKQLIRQSKKDIQAVVPVPHSLVEDLLVAAAAPATSTD